MVLSEQDIYESDPMNDSTQHYRLECTSRAPFAVSALMTAEEDPTIDPSLLESIIMFNRTSDNQEVIYKQTFNQNTNHAGFLQCNRVLFCRNLVKIQPVQPVVPAAVGLLDR